MKLKLVTKTEGLDEAFAEAATATFAVLYGKKIAHARARYLTIDAKGICGHVTMPYWDGLVFRYGAKQSHFRCTLIDDICLDDAGICWRVLFGDCATTPKETAIRKNAVGIGDLVEHPVSGRRAVIVDVGENFATLSYDFACTPFDVSLELAARWVVRS